MADMKVPISEDILEVGEIKQSVRIQTMSQWYLLRQLNHNGCLGKKRIPNEVMDRILRMLHDKELTGSDFIVLCFKKVRDTFFDIEDIIDVYPYRIKLSEDIDTIPVTYPNGRRRDWYVSHVRIKGQKTKVKIIYTTKTH